MNMEEPDMEPEGIMPPIFIALVPEGMGMCMEIVGIILDIPDLLMPELILSAQSFMLPTIGPTLS